MAYIKRTSHCPESNPIGFNYGTQSGTFEAPGSDGTHRITQFQFNHSVLGAAASFDAPNSPSAFSTADGFTNEITITGGAVINVSLLVNNTTAPASISIDFGNSILDAVDIFDAVDRGGSKIDETSFGSAITFTQQTAGAPYHHNQAPAVLILGVLFAIKKLRQKLRDKTIAMKQVSRIVPERVCPRLGNRKKHEESSHINMELSSY